MSRLATVFVFAALALLSASASAAPSLSASPSSVPLGGSVTATWSGIGSPTGTDWIGVYAPGAADNQYVTYRYTTGAANGSVPVTVPSNIATGTYELRLFANNGYTRLATSNTFSVTVVNITLAVTPAGVLPGGTVTAEWSGIPAPTGLDWLGLYVAGAANNAQLSWRYTTGASSGSVPFTIPAGTAPGTYELRLLANNTYTAYKISNSFGVHLSVAGTVTYGGSPLAGVTLSASGGGSCGNSNASGQYTCNVPLNWSGSVTPALAGYVFTPESRSYTSLTANQSAQNYTAAAVRQVSGTVRIGASPLSGATLAGTNGATCTSSDASGQYTCTVPLGWSGSVTPSLGSHAFYPVSRSYANVITNQTVQDYAVSYQVTGTVTLGSSGLGGVAIAANNSGGQCTSSAGNGQYACTVPHGWSGSVTPTLEGYSFTPASRNLSNVTANQGGQDFAAADAQSAKLFFIHVDHLNTPRLVANAQGQTVWRWDQQEPFGVNVPDENPSGLGTFEFPFRLPGQYYDTETTINYNYYRDYDPTTGRYAESDPIGLRAGLNTYAYADSNPLSFVDVLGLKATCMPGTRCFSTDLDPLQRLPAPLPQDPRKPPSNNKPEPEFCANTQGVLANCQQCCERLARTFRDPYFISPCNIACNDKFACKPGNQLTGLGVGLTPDMYFVF